jgi:hypothetical protein
MEEDLEVFKLTLVFYFGSSIIVDRMFGSQQLPELGSQPIATLSNLYHNDFAH